MDPLRVVGLGWGAQSFGLAVLSAEGKLPQIDIAIFADTTYESQATYDYIKEYQPYLERKGIRVMTVTDPSITDGTTAVDEWDAVYIPAFTKDAESHEPMGLLRRQCTGRWKIDPIRRIMQKERKPKQKCELWLGITLDEIQRMKPSQVQYITNVYPYVDELGWSRGDVVHYLQSMDIADAPKSACVFCPYRSDESMKKVKAGPDKDWALAVEMDEAIRHKRDGYLSYVRRDLKPLSEIEFDTGQQEMFTEECEGYCGL
jgi:hypothetical protein